MKKNKLDPKRSFIRQIAGGPRKKKPNPRQMLTVARDFAATFRELRDPDNVFRPWVSLTCGAFALEVLLKALLVHEGQTIDDVRVHDPSPVFLKLSPRAKALIGSCWTPPIEGAAVYFRLLEVDRLFDDARYVYELAGASFDFAKLDVALRALERAASLVDPAITPPPETR